ncbi:MAG: YfcC family protein [Bacteroidales bacterium]|nr:YfcC family protein [Bacteroidales bacterium]
MKKFKVPNTYVIIFTVIAICAISTWFVPGGNPQTWQVFSALYEGFSQQAGIIAFVLIIGGAFWVVNSTKSVDEGIMAFISKVNSLERFSLVRKMGVGNIVIVLIMLLFGLFGAVFGMSEETIAFVAVVIPLAKSLGYDEIVGVCMVYVAAHVGFAGAMLNPFTIGIAQDMSGLPLFSGIEYRVFCWTILMLVAIAFVLWYAAKIRKKNTDFLTSEKVHEDTRAESKELPKKKAWICMALLTVVTVLFSVSYADECSIKLGQSEFAAPWLMWVADAFFVFFSILSLRASVRMYILDLLMFTIVYMVIGVMGYGWYLPEICALFMVLGVAAGFSAGYSADDISKEFIAGAKDIFSAALVIGFAAGIIVILKNGQVIDTMLGSMASALDGAGRAGALGTMYGIQTFINLFIPSASAKAAVTMPIMAPFSDMIGVSRQATVLAFQFGDGFTNMITPCSGVLMAVLSVARIPYEKWFRWVWKFILLLVVLGFILLLPTLWLDLPGF